MYVVQDAMMVIPVWNAEWTYWARLSIEGTTDFGTGEEAERVEQPHFSLAVAQTPVAVQKNRLGARKSTLVLSHSRNPAKT